MRGARTPFGKTFSVTPEARRRRRATDCEDFDEQESRDEAADVRRVCDAALLRAAAEQPDAARELEQKPKAERDVRSEEHTSELQSQSNLVCRLLLEKK